jgi:pimeloyl-ACP methyl ester carboxylesterase
VAGDVVDDVSTYALIHGGAHGGSCWYLLAAELERRGHVVVAPDLPIDDEPTLRDHAQVVLDAVEASGPADEVVVVAHSLGGLVGPIVAEELDAVLLVLLAAMVPQPGETCLQLLEATGYAPRVESEEVDDVASEADDRVIMSDAAAIAAFYHDVAPDVAARAVSELRGQSSSVFSEPWPLAAWPDVATRYILARDDRMVSPGWARRVTADRLGIVPDEIDGGHSPFLSRPAELADLLEQLRLQDPDRRR